MMQMRDATKEEQEGIRKYIDSISVRMIPITVLEDIKREIQDLKQGYPKSHDSFDDYSDGMYDAFNSCLRVIDKYISGKE